MNLIDRILRHWGYIRLPKSADSPVVIAVADDLAQARRLTEEFKREVGPIDAELAVFQVKMRRGHDAS